jgi:hypothetical protein
LKIQNALWVLQAPDNAKIRSAKIIAARRCLFTRAQQALGADGIAGQVRSALVMIRQLFVF